MHCDGVGGGIGGLDSRAAERGQLSFPAMACPALGAGGSFTSLSPAHGGQPSLAVNTAEAEGW